MQPIFTCFTENLNYALGWMVIHSLWQATVIAIVAGIAAIVGRKKSPQLRYWIYNAALFSVLIAAIVTFCVYFDFSKEAGQTVFIPENFAAATDELGKAGINQVISDTQTGNAPLSIEGLRMYFNRNIYLIVTIWVLGVALFILKLLGGISYVYYLRSRLNFPADEYWLEMVEQLGEKAGVKRTMELVESALVRSPLVVGHLKPMILFPIGAINKLNPQEVEAILAHEIAHVLRNDYIFNIVQSVIEALFYFHPAVWWISANIRAERENCCDDVAIALCGNSMTYAKALVSLQEMAYFQSPQIAMAFAGKQKNQLLFRVQRILKQPQNKTNVMEKLIATCLLLVMMVALSFGGNHLNNNNLADIKALESTTPPPTGVETNKTLLTSTTANLAKKHYLKFKTNGVLDSFPVGKDVADGNYNYADNMFQAKLTVKENAVVKLNINGSEIPPAEIKNHVGFINKIIMRSAAPPQYDEDNQPIFPTPASPVPPVAPAYPYTTTTSMPTFSESNGDMVVNNGDGSQTTISHRSENGNKVQVVTTTQKDGSHSITRSDKNGTVSETYDKNGRKITSNTVGRFPGQNLNGGERTYIGKGENTVTNYNDDGTKSVITFDQDGGKLVKIYKNETELIHTIKMLNGQITIDGRAAKDSELRTLGFERRGNGIQKIGGYLNIQPDRTKGTNMIITTNGASNVSVSTNDNTDDEDPADKFEEIKEQIADLKEEIKECECTTNKDFRSKLIKRLDDLRGKLNKNLSIREMQKIESEYDMIHQTWENGECADNDTDNNGNIGYGNSKGSKGSKGSKNNGNGASTSYSYGYGDSYSAAETARKDAERARRLSGTSKNKADKPDMMQIFFLDLVNRGLINANVKNRVEFDNSHLKINGKYVDNATFSSVKNGFESHLTNKNRPYSIAYSGIVTNVSSTGLSIQGTLSTSLNDN